MNIVSFVRDLREILLAALHLTDAALDLIRRVRTLWPWRPPGSAYDTLSLSLTLQIQDAKGHEAVLLRRQRVRFRHADAGVVRETYWSDGIPQGPALVRGANQLGGRREGLKHVSMLDVGRIPARAEVFDIETERGFHDALTREEEFLEAAVERTTQSLQLAVVFPANRHPLAGRGEHSPAVLPARRLRPRVLADGRTALSWRVPNPKPLTTYRLAWCW